MADLVAGPDVHAVPPPFLAAEDHVLAIDPAHAGLIVAVPVIECDQHGLRCDYVPEFGRRRKSLVPVDRVDVVHRHDPAADVRLVAWLPQLAAADLVTKSPLDVADIHFDPGIRFGHVPLLLAKPRDAGQACNVAGSSLRDIVAQSEPYGLTYQDKVFPAVADLRVARRCEGDC